MNCRAAASLVVALVLAACDEVSSSYDTLDAAREGGVFERGWLPDLLPKSAHSIHVSNDVNLNTSQGEFEFSPVDFEVLESSLRGSVPDTAPFSDWQSFVSKRREEGNVALAYSKHGTVWVFVCNVPAGRCLYRAWQQSGAA